MKILVADDDRTSRDLTGAVLRALGHEVLLASDGDDAWGQVQREHFDVLVSDWIMPGVDGPELCRRTRGLGGRRYTYIILLTLLEGRSHYVEGLSAGADDFLSKPFDAEMVEARLRVAERILGLQEEVHQLTGLLPICSYCHSMRDEDDWIPLERYIMRRTEASFTHGICPACVRTRIQPEMERLRAERGAAGRSSGGIPPVGKKTPIG
jgi:DNA-binding response OmpR family regulator